jgi:predicted RecA/RadA family phage recombinase
MTTLAGTSIPGTVANVFPVCNYSATAIAAGAVLAIDATNTTAAQQATNPGMVGRAVIICASGSIPVGVAKESIPAAVNGVPGSGPAQRSGFVDGGVANSAAGAIAVGNLVGCDTGGQVKAVTAGSQIPIVGIAWSAAAAQGDLIDIELMLTPSS